MADPELSIIIAASHAAHTLRECLRALMPQLRARAIEVCVVTSSDAEAHITREQLPSANVIAVERETLIPVMWGRGVTQARGRIVALTIATCIPDAHWVEEILRAHAAYHTAIGGAIENARGSSLVDWAVYFVRYTPYMLPFAAGAMEVPGDNGTYKRAALDEQMQWIEQHGFWENEINARLREEKRSLWGDPRIIVYHQKSFSLLGFSKQRFAHGRIFGRMRAARTPERDSRSGTVPFAGTANGVTRRQRTLYIVSAPAIPFLYLARIVKRLARKRRNLPQFVSALPLIVWFLLCWAAGEWLGLLRD